MRGLPVAIALAVKIAAAVLPVYYMYPLGIRFAESWMRVRDPRDGFGNGFLVALGVFVAFVGSSALAASGAGRTCMVRACAATAWLVGSSTAVVLAAWLTKIPSPSRGAEMIATHMYVKYPPIEAIWPLIDLARSFGFVTLLADIATTIAIVRSCAPRQRSSRDVSASTAGTSTAAP